MIDFSEEDIRQLEERTQMKVSGQNLVITGMAALDMLQRITDIYKTLSYEQWMAFYGPGFREDEEKPPEEEFDDFKAFVIAYYEYMFDRLTCAQLAGGDIHESR